MYVYTHTHTHTHTHTMLSHSAIQRNEILPFTATWMDLENVLSEVSQRKTNIYHMWNLKNTTNEPIYKTERGLQT